MAGSRFFGDSDWRWALSEKKKLKKLKKILGRFCQATKRLKDLLQLAAVNFSPPPPQRAQSELTTTTDEEIALCLLSHTQLRLLDIKDESAFAEIEIQNGCLHMPLPKKAIRLVMG